MTERQYGIAILGGAILAALIIAYSFYMGSSDAQEPPLSATTHDFDYDQGWSIVLKKTEEFIPCHYVSYNDAGTLIICEEWNEADQFYEEVLWYPTDEVLRVTKEDETLP